MNSQEELQQQLSALVTEADALRDSAGEPDITESLTDLHIRLVTTRKAQDRLEGIVGSLLRLRWLARKTARARKDEWDDAMDEAIRTTKAAEYSTAREREAQYGLSTFDQKRAWRSAERNLASVDTAYEFAVLRHRGIDAARRDVETRARLLTVESRLERT